MDRRARSSRFKYPSVVEVAAALSLARFWLPWEHEAPTRHRIRVLLVLQGMPWGRADFIGHSLVARARAENGVGFPRGWDSDHEQAEWWPDSACPICDKPFKRKWIEQSYCSTACSRRNAEIELWAESRVGRTGPPQCAWCREFLETDDPRETYCTATCRIRAEGLAETENRWLAAIPCTICHTLYIPVTVHSHYCSHDCRLAARRAARHGESIDKPQAVPNPRTCDHCGESYLPAVINQRFCSRRCSHRAADDPVAKKTRRRDRDHVLRELRDIAEPRFCGWCSEPLPIGCSLKRLFCSADCKTRMDIRRAGERYRRRANGHTRDEIDHRSDPPDRPEPAGGAPGARADQTGAGGGAERMPRAD